VSFCRTWAQQIVLEALKIQEASDDNLRDPWEHSTWNEQALSIQARNSGTSDGAIIVQEYTNKLKGDDKRRVIKTHASYGLRPWKTQCDGRGKIIVVIRNPFDAAISMYHHACDVRAFDYDGSGGLEEFINDLWLPGKVESGDFWKWMKGWRVAFENFKNIHWLSFEELHSDPHKAVTDIVNFLNLDRVTAADIDTIVVNSSFSKMKSNFEENDRKKLAEGKKIKPNHIRKGGVGGYKSVLSEEMQVKMAEEHCERCAKDDLDIGIFSFV